ncbi:MAG TPA: 50S ribosomal protein L15 [bacterium]|jgi:large subunit ribosomal protein L15|nr:50S ribosomal protein L15 [Dictyoglomota bacterium]HHV80995.1 50S ribosomal protein L15 [bacterium]HOK29548.1 50S ribosomal protein L15 [bacterium]HOL54859.1 50S ribosomal protein L15 [bacterium]HON71868.1 50S ribosomal protein L15 [bacterium]
MVKLSELSPPDGAVKDRIRIGRGHGSGKGKTSGRGIKGQGSRSGDGVMPGFEGGQTPLQRRLPHLPGFKNRFKKVYAIVNVGTLNQLEEGTVVTPELLLERGIIKDLYDGLKILGGGSLEKSLTVRAHKFSGQAKEKITSSGGNVEVIS